MDDMKFRPSKPGAWRQWVTSAACAALLVASMPAPLMAQNAPPPGGPPGGPGGPPPGPQSQDQGYSAEQLDAVLAPIALYPDQLLTQVLMASAFPDQVTEAANWCQVPANQALRGDALTAALVPLQWDPSVKSLVPFPQVLQTMTSQPEWLQQLGYAMSVQQPAVMDSVQRLRRQAQIAGQLNTTPQQVVSTQENAIVIEPAQPNVVYVPAYNPTVVYGGWQYPDYPPYYLPPPVAFYGGGAVIGGLAFGIGIGITAGLWGWARPNWGGRNVFINVNRYNVINVNRPWVGGAAWRPIGRPIGRPAWGYRPGAGYRPHPGGFVPPGGGFRPGAPGFRPPPPPGGFHPTPGGGFRPPSSRPGSVPGHGFSRPGAPPGGAPRPGPAPRPGTPRPPSGTRPSGTPPSSGHRPNTPSTSRPSHSAPPSRPRPTEPARPPSHEAPSRPAPAARPQAPARPAPAARPSGGERPRPAEHNGGGNKRPK